MDDSIGLNGLKVFCNENDIMQFNGTLYCNLSEVVKIQHIYIRNSLDPDEIRSFLRFVRFNLYLNRIHVALIQSLIIKLTFVESDCFGMALVYVWFCI